MRSIARLPTACAALFALLLTACGDGGSASRPDEETMEVSFAPPEMSDTAASRIAREVLGGGVRKALAVRAGDGERIAAARDVRTEGPDPLEPLASVSRYAYEVVVLERSGADGWKQETPGLYAFDEQDHARRAEVDGGDTAGLGRPRAPDLLFGVGDADGDGDDEVWAASLMSGATAFSIDLRAFDAESRMLYRFQAPSTEHAERLNHAAAELSPSVDRSPAMRRWLAETADSAVARWQRASLAEP